MSLLIKFLATIVLSMVAAPAYAYLGPGLGGGVLSVVLGFIVAVFLAIFAVVWYPLKRIFIKFKTRNKKSGVIDENEGK